MIKPEKETAEIPIKKTDHVVLTMGSTSILDRCIDSARRECARSGPPIRMVARRTGLHASAAAPRFGELAQRKAK